MQSQNQSDDQNVELRPYDLLTSAPGLIYVSLLLVVFTVALVFLIWMCVCRGYKDERRTNVNLVSDLTPVVEGTWRLHL